MRLIMLTGWLITSSLCAHEQSNDQDGHLRLLPSICTQDYKGADSEFLCAQLEAEVAVQKEACEKEKGVLVRDDARRSYHCIVK